MSLRTRGPRGPARRHVPDLCGPAPLHLPDLCQTQVPVPLADGREAAPPALPPARQRRFEAYSRLRRGVYHTLLSNIINVRNYIPELIS